MTQLNQLRSTFLKVRRHYKLATKCENMWGGKYKQAKLAWDEFEALLEGVIQEATGASLNTRVILRRGDHEGLREFAVAVCGR
jgi:hypothetical protein